MKNKSLYTALIYWFLMLGLVLYLSGCRTKKVIQDTHEEKTKEIIKKSEKETKEEDKKTEEKGLKFTEEKATEKADRKTETTDDKGNKTIIYENYYKGTESKSNEEFQKVVSETIVSLIERQNETNRQLYSEITKLQEKEVQLKNSLIYGSIAAVVVLLLVFGYILLKKYKII